MFRIVGGDFNLRPNYAEPPYLPLFDKWRDDYIEPNESPPYQETLIGSGGKIDYIWALDVAEVTSTQFDVIALQFPGAPTSDHYYYESEFRFEI